MKREALFKKFMGEPLRVSVRAFREQNRARRLTPGGSHKKQRLFSNNA